MTLLLVVFGLVVVVAVGAGLRRRLADERNSVRDYQQTLETLRHLSERRPPVAGRPHEEEMARSRAETAKARASTMLASSTRLSERARRDAAFSRSGASPVSGPAEASPAKAAKRRRAPSEVPAAVAAEEAPAPREAVPVAVGAPARAAQAVRELIAHPELHGPVRSRAMPGIRRRPRPRAPVAWTAAAVVAIAVVTGVALAMGPAAPTRATAPTVTAAPPPVRHLSATRPSSSSHRPSSPPPPAALDPVTSSTTSATYDLPPSPAALTLSASGPCWVQATVPSTGQVLWTGTLQSGQAQSIPAASGALLRLGNATNVQVTVGGVPVHLPSGFALVFDMTFLPA